MIRFLWRPVTSVSPGVCVCVAGGVAAPELQPGWHTCTQFQSNHSLFKSLVDAPHGRRIHPSSCSLMCVLWFEVLPELAELPVLRVIHVRLHASLLAVQPTSTCPALPAVSSRPLPSLLFVPFRPAPPGPAQPAVPSGTDLTWSSRRPAVICPPGQPPFRRYLTLLLPLPVPAGPYLFHTSCNPRGIHSSRI